MEGMEAGPAATLTDAALSPKKRIHGSWEACLRLYAKLPNPIGRPLGHAAGDSNGVSAVMKEMVLKTLQRIPPPFFDEAFRDLGDAWNGAREGKSLRQYMAGCHCGRMGRRRARAYRQSLPLSQKRSSLLPAQIQACWSGSAIRRGALAIRRMALSDEVCEIRRGEPLYVANAKISKNVVNRRDRFLTNDVAKATFKSGLKC